MDESLQAANDEQHQGQSDIPCSSSTISNAGYFSTLAKIVDHLKNLPVNPRIQVSEDGKFKFKPPYKINGKKNLLKLLRKRHENADGAVLLSDLAECVPFSEKLLESLGKEAIVIVTKWNGKQDKAILWNDQSTDFL
ncbi:hypothetical protein PRIPAC_88153 [Pristionchus pacificus]|uniref:TFA2_Winged_2 domain-containing protein n=1 Tax=Pristionchus pacificus TaxID=54126 RepID=A0A2A6CTC6_PRIPA|nr:hypothetical protein PRIPAC_88153 [Pristionchus pacificus]|eukprot:PDM81360.1 hypothetical protein PRIPAC_35236 [Pristionchus pacificus]